jgi:hypothetical protein
MTTQDLRKLAFKFILIIGVVNLFADMTYEGARSISGPFLGSLGARATAVGFVAGFGELLGYGLRSVSGYFADRTHNYWAAIFAGYAPEESWRPARYAVALLALVAGSSPAGPTNRVRDLRESAGIPSAAAVGTCALPHHAGRRKVTTNRRHQLPTELRTPPLPVVPQNTRAYQFVYDPSGRNIPPRFPG